MIKHIIALSICVACANVSSSQDARQVAIISCNNAASNAMRAQLTGPNSLRFAPDPLVGPKGRGAVGVRGRGQYLEAESRTWRAFTYDCTYRTHSAKTAVTVQIDSAAVPR